MKRVGSQLQVHAESCALYTDGDFCRSPTDTSRQLGMIRQLGGTREGSPVWRGVSASTLSQPKRFHPLRGAGYQ
jgi:hypothetical protein